MQTVSVRGFGFSGVLFSLAGCMGGGAAADMMVASTGMKIMMQAT